MAFSIAIDLRDRVSAQLGSTLEALRQTRINPVLARAAVNLTRGHLFRMESERPNKLGGDRTHFYAQCARATHFTLLPDGFILSINHVGFRQRFEGGTINMKDKMLTIPARAEAYGKRAVEFSDLRFAVVGGFPALVQADRTEITMRKGKDGVYTAKSKREWGGLVYFWLARSVTQQADQTLLPGDSEYEEALLGASGSYIETLKERFQEGGNS